MLEPYLGDQSILTTQQSLTSYGNADGLVLYYHSYSNKCICLLLFFEFHFYVSRWYKLIATILQYIRDIVVSLNSK